MNRAFFLAGAVAILAITVISQQPAGPAPDEYSARELAVSPGGRPAVALTQPAPRDRARPAIVAAEVLPGMAMNIHQLRAYVPGLGVIDMLEAPPLEKLPPTPRSGGSILLPWANRIRGTAVDDKTIETEVLGRKLKLPLSRRGDGPNASHSIHGLLLGRPMDQVRTSSQAGSAAVNATLDAGDFGGHWPSRAQVTVAATLKDGAFLLEVTTRNIGSETLPVAAGWHPNFLYPSGERGQVRLRLPASRRAPANNYQDVFPTGVIEEVRGTAYDFSASGGAPLKDLFLDDCFLGLNRNPAGHAVAEMADPAAKYGVRVVARSPEVRAIQVFAPLNRKLVAIEPQFNLVDPFGKAWDASVDTGMVKLAPGESVTYAVQVEVFIP